MAVVELGLLGSSVEDGEEVGDRVDNGSTMDHRRSGSSLFLSGI